MHNLITFDLMRDKDKNKNMNKKANNNKET